jgi:hypothetical protein
LLVPGIDEPHLLDDHSAALVQLLAEIDRCSIVATVRSGETVPDSITALWKDELAELLELQPLSPRRWSSSCNRCSNPDRPVDPAAAMEPIARQRAIPARAMLRWHGAFADIPRLADVLDERLRTVGAEQPALLEVVAALGTPLFFAFPRYLREVLHPEAPLLSSRPRRGTSSSSHKRRSSRAKRTSRSEGAG